MLRIQTSSPFSERCWLLHPNGIVLSQLLYNSGILFLKSLIWFRPTNLPSNFPYFDDELSFSKCESTWCSLLHNGTKKNLTSFLYMNLWDFWGGKRGIRTPGPSQVNGFQDRRIRPLCHLSICVSRGWAFITLPRWFCKDTKKFVFARFLSNFVFNCVFLQEIIFIDYT